MQLKRIHKSLAAMTIMLMAAGVVSVSAQRNPHYQDHASKVEKTTALAREYLKSHPGNTADSLRANVLGALTDGKIVTKSPLPSPRKKKLTPAQLYELASKSSLIVCKMEHNDAFQMDSAYKIASAVALTSDGICATNFHVVSDFVLCGSLGKQDKNDMLRFVMDYDGNIYPITAVLAIDPLNDWSIIKVDTQGRKLTPAPMGGDLPVGSPVYCLSSTTGSHFYLTDGLVANCLQSTDKRTGFTKYILEITADYGVGASGGPIFDEYGNLVALVSSTVSVYAQPEQYRNFQMTYKETVPVFLIKERFK